MKSRFECQMQEGENSLKPVGRPPNKTSIEPQISPFFEEVRIAFFRRVQWGGDPLAPGPLSKTPGPAPPLKLGRGALGQHLPKRTGHPGLEKVLDLVRPAQRVVWGVGRSGPKQGPRWHVGGEQTTHGLGSGVSLSWLRN